MINKNILSQILAYWKEELIGLIIFLLCISLALFFPASGSLQKFSNVFFFLFLLPFLYIRFILKKDLRDFGFNLRNKKNGFLWAGAMLGVSLLIIFILVRFFEFQNHYFLPAYIATRFGAFLFYELVLVNFIFFLQEFFFKGFFLFTLEKKLGFISFFVQAVLFTIFIILAQSFAWQIAPFVILSLTGGIVAYKSKSFIYAYLMGLVFLIILDSYIIYLFK